MSIDWKNLPLYQYFLLGGGAMALLAVIAYYLKGSSLKIPTVVASGIGFFAIGIGTGMSVLLAMGYEKSDGHRTPPRAGDARANNNQEPAATGQGPGGGGGGRMGRGGMPNMGQRGGGMGGMGGGGMPGGGMPGMAGGGRGRGGMPGGGFVVPSAKRSLVNFVAKLDLLTGPGVTLKLSDEQKSLIAQQVSELADLDDLTEEQARGKLGALMKALKDDQQTFESVGFNWTEMATFSGGATPAAPAGGRGAPPRKDADGKAADGKAPPLNNPFRDAQNKQHLKEVVDRTRGAVKEPAKDKQEKSLKGLRKYEK